MADREHEFKTWLGNVDVYVQRLCGLSVYDLPDLCYPDMFEDGLPPSTAARRAIRAAGECGA